MVINFIYKHNFIHTQSDRFVLRIPSKTVVAFYVRIFHPLYRHLANLLMNIILEQCFIRFFLVGFYLRPCFIHFLKFHSFVVLSSLPPLASLSLSLSLSLSIYIYIYIYVFNFIFNFKIYLFFFFFFFFLFPFFFFTPPLSFFSPTFFLFLYCVVPLTFLLLYLKSDLLGSPLSMG